MTHTRQIPDKIDGELLDNCLERGYYRMQQDMFTTNFIIQEQQVMPVYWLRTRLDYFTMSSSMKEIIRKNKNFRNEIKPFEYTQELEDLFSSYKTGIPFQASESVAAYLFEDHLRERFNTWIIKLWDGNQLIGFGIFDCGQKSIAGIMNVYHPNYKKYSIGKWMMLQKMIFAREMGAMFYYTGYISTGTTRFDYKLFPNENWVEIWSPEMEIWFPYLLMPVK